MDLKPSRSDDQKRPYFTTQIKKQYKHYFDNLNKSSKIRQKF